MDWSSVDSNVGAAMVNLGSALSTLVLKGTATAIHGKIESIKKEQNADTVRNVYNEIVNQLLEEREDAVRIAQTYKQELEKVVISDEDIEYLQQTITKALDIINALQLVDSFSDDPAKQTKAKASINAIDSIKNLISKDVLKTMQLLGFNFKAAIGEPLTQVCAAKITALGEKKNSNNTQRKK
jgi:hypothetical protein